MESPARHRRAAALIARYLDPRRPWTGEEERELRAHLRECDACREHYGRVVTAHRLTVGAEPEGPSGFEAERLLTGILDQVEAGSGPMASPVPHPRRRLAWIGALAGLGAAAALALLVLVPRTGPDDGLRPRGAGEEAEEAVGLGVTGVTAGGAEYEVVASHEAHLDDWFRFSYTNERPELRWLFVVGVQEGRPPIWYAPLPEEGQSVAIGTGRMESFDFEVRLGARHGPGPLKIVALFTPEPLPLSRIEEGLEDDWATLEPAALERAVRQAIALPEGTVIRVLSTRVLPGSARGAEVDGAR